MTENVKADLIDMYNFVSFIAKTGTEKKSAHATKSVDADTQLLFGAHWIRKNNYIGIQEQQRNQTLFIVDKLFRSTRRDF